MESSFGELIDRLVILNLKIWHLEDELRAPGRSDSELGRITRVLTSINEQRTQLKAEIDDRYGAGARDIKIYRSERRRPRQGTTTGEKVDKLRVSDTRRISRRGGKKV